MTTRNPYCAAKRPHLHVVETTTPKPGQIILMRHGAYRVNDRGGYEYVGRSPIAPIPGPAPLLVNAHPQWPSMATWALMGLAMGLLVVWGICS